METLKTALEKEQRIREKDPPASSEGNLIMIMTISALHDEINAFD